MQDGKIVVLQVIGGLSIGGAESRIMDILRELDRDRFRYDFLLNEAPGAYEEEAKSLGCNIYRTVKYKVYNKGRYLKELRDFFAEHPGIDIVQGHSTNTAALYLPLAKAAGVPVTIAHARSAGVEPGLKGWLKKQTRKCLFEKADVCFSCSREAAAAVFGEEHLREVRIIPNAIKAMSFAPTEKNVAAGAALRKELGTENAFVVGHVGRFHYAKNHRFLLQVFCEILKKKPEAMLLLVGDGEDREKIEQWISEFKLKDKVIMPGMQRDTAKYYQAMDVMVFPSFYEGLPGTVVEAQCAALPCVLSDTITEDVSVTPLLRYMSLKESAEEWAQTALELSDKYPRGARNGALEYCEAMKDKGFDVTAQVKELQNIYKGLLDEYGKDR